MTARPTTLDTVLERLVDAAMTGDDDAARRAFADAQAHPLAEVGASAGLWAELERRAAEALPDTQTASGLDAALARLRRSGSS